MSAAVQTTLFDTGGEEGSTLAELARSAYRDYAMYVLRDRALPNVRDGLKPVQRRILYAMGGLGLRTRERKGTGTKDPFEKPPRHKKSARTIGDVLGKYHPHGDQACYEAMVRLAQPFSLRHPFIDGQGNWGSPDDPSSFAAMRYTEARLGGFAETVLAELSRDTVEWTRNFDGTEWEPEALPARIPVLLVNGSTGIAVGMSCDVLPHNLAEVVEAAVLVLRNGRIPDEELARAVPGPDLPGGGILIPDPDDPHPEVRRGEGRVRHRAAWTEVDAQILVIEALPWEARTGRVLEQIGQQIERGEIECISEVRDESDEQSPIRIVVELKRGRITPAQLMGHLFATTDLERTLRISHRIIGLDGNPQLLGIKAILKQWVEFRRDTVKRRTQARLDAIAARRKRIETLLKAMANLDEIVRILREEDKPKEAIIEALGIDAEEADALLGTRVRALAKLEGERLRSEDRELGKEQGGLEALLDSPTRLNNLIEREMRRLAANHGDERRTVIDPDAPPAAKLSREVMAASEPVTVILSRDGYVRQAKGHQIEPTSLSWRNGDEHLASCRTESGYPIVFLDSSGRSYSTRVSTLPSARSLGDSLAKQFSPPAGARWKAVLGGTPEDEVTVLSDAGYGFTTRIADLETTKMAGRVVLTHDTQEAVYRREERRTHLAVVTTDDMMLVVETAEIPERARAKGIKIIGIGKGAKTRLAHAVMIDEHETLVMMTQHGEQRLGPKHWTGYIARRGTKGKKLPPRQRGVTSIDTTNGTPRAAENA